MTRSAPFAVFALLFGIYILTTGGHQYAVDEEKMFAATESLALHGSFALNAGGGGTPTYSTYGPAQSIAALPLYWVGRALAVFWPAEAYPWVTRLAVSWFNPLVTAGVAALVAVAASVLGYGRRASIGAALLYGLGTMAWPHSKTFFAEPLTALVLFGAFVLALEFRVQSSEFRVPGEFRIQNSEFRILLARVFVSGVLAGIAPAIKIQAGLTLPLLGLFVLVQNWQVLTPRRQYAVAQRTFLVPRAFAALRSRRLVVWCVGALLPLLLLALYQWALFGSPLQSGYGNVGGGFSTPFFVGFGGQLWSFGRGIIWYAPPLVLSPLGLWWMWRKHRAMALLCGAMFMAHVLFYATWWAWDGAGAWGPRFLNVALPFLVLPLAAVLERTTDDRRSTTGSIGRRPLVVGLALATLLAFTIPVQIAGLSINLNSYFSLTRGAGVSVWRPADSAIVVHWSLLANRARGVYDQFLAPDSVVLQSGFSYSEGMPILDARWGEKLGLRESLPRWTSDRAIVAVRPPHAPTELQLTLNSCAASVPVRIHLLLDSRMVMPEHTACPARAYTLLLPPRPSMVVIIATSWNPVSFGGDRDETLGVRVEALQVRAGDLPLVLRGETVPVSFMPNEVTATKYWMLDHRYAHWDYWWWYFAHNRYPIANNLIFGVLWLLVGFGSILVGWWLLVWGASGK